MIRHLSAIALAVALSGCSTLHPASGGYVVEFRDVRSTTSEVVTWGFTRNACGSEDAHVFEPGSVVVACSPDKYGNAHIKVTFRRTGWEETAETSMPKFKGDKVLGGGFTYVVIDATGQRPAGTGSLNYKVMAN